MAPRGAAGPSPTDKEDPAFWRAAKSGDFISLRDAEAFAEGGSEGVDYEVGEVRAFALLGPERAALLGPERAAPRGIGGRALPGKPAPRGEYRFIELKREASGPLYLALVESGAGFELRLYFIPAGLEPGTRDDCIDRGETWLFLPPANPEDFVSSELEYAPYPDVPEITEGGEGRKYLFSRVGAGSLYGESLDSGSPVIITEYEAEPEAGEKPPENGLLLALEEGWMRPDGTLPEEGGYVTILLGKVMRTSDLEYYPT